MNHIKIQKVMTQYGYEEEYWHIAGTGLPEYLDKCITESADEYLKELGSFIEVYSEVKEVELCRIWKRK